jgi:1-acyl-sn-glycerol-3-phosphate acyltransferase
MTARTDPAFLSAIATYLRRYHRHEVIVDTPRPTEQTLFVANHGFGGVVDLNALALRTALDQLRGDRQVTYLVHQLAWTVGLGSMVESLGGRPGSVESLRDAFAAGNHVAVFPGGDIDAAKATRDRNRITFSGRSGFAKMAIEHGVDVVPVVTVGAGESLFVFTDGQQLAKALRLPALLRLKSMPVSLSFPWGLSVGLVGLLPYVPLPTKLVTAVLPPMRAGDDESAADFAARVEAAMQARLDDLAAGRLPILG